MTSLSIVTTSSLLLYGFSAAVILLVIFAIVFFHFFYLFATIPYTYPFLYRLLAFDIRLNTTEEIEKERRKFDYVLKLAGKGTHVSLHDIQDVQIPNKQGDYQIPLRIYYPLQKNDEEIPSILIFFHGGGWVLGSISSYDSLCRLICSYTGCILISVDYRLAPEYHYPHGLNDCYDATLWTIENALKLGSEKGRIFIGGDSAGGNLAAAVVLKLREEDIKNNLECIQGQILIYPVLNFDFNPLSYKTYGSHYLLSLNSVKAYWKCYLTGAGNKSWGNHIYQSPLRSNVQKIPSTLIFTADYDVLQDEAFAYIEKLKQQNISVKHVSFPTMHGYMGICSLNYTLKSIQNIKLFIKSTSSS